MGIESSCTDAQCLSKHMINCFLGKSLFFLIIEFCHFAYILTINRKSVTNENPKAYCWSTWFIYHWTDEW